MPATAASPRVRRSREARAAARRASRIAALVVATAALLITLLLTAFGSSSTRVLEPTAPAPATRLLPAGPPRPQVIALRGSLRIQMPVAQSRVTAIGYHATSGGAMALSPVGRQANVELHHLRPGPDGGLERCQCVLRLEGGSTPVGDHQTTIVEFAPGYCHGPAGLTILRPRHSGSPPAPRHSGPEDRWGSQPKRWSH